MGTIYVSRTFIRRSHDIGVLPPAICFERDLAHEMAEADGGIGGVAVYEPDPARGSSEAQPFAAFGRIPDCYRRIGRDALLAAAPDSMAMAEVR
jgi:hypothetical protein